MEDEDLFKMALEVILKHVRIQLENGRAAVVLTRNEGEVVARFIETFLV